MKMFLHKAQCSFALPIENEMKIGVLCFFSHADHTCTSCHLVILDPLTVLFTSACIFQTMLFLATVEEEGQVGEGRREMAETLLSALTDRHQQRQTWRDR